MDPFSEQTERFIPRGISVSTLGIALVLAAVATAGWEGWARNMKLDTGYHHDSNALWSRARRAANATDDPLVIVGSSRIFFNVDLDVWEEVAGRRPIMLALEGTDPVPFLKDLANDPDFNGTVLVGVTPPLFFTGYAERKGVLEYYRDETPAQRFGQMVNLRIEPWFAFMGAGRRDLALFQLLRRMELPNRPGVMPPHLDIRDIADSDADRNTRLWHQVWEDPVLNQATKDRWHALLTSIPPPPPDAPPFDAKIFFGALKPDVDRLRARGGDVVFVRSPSSGFFADVEAQAFPRAVFWDEIASNLEAGTIHFADNPSLQGFDTPEWSHLRADHRAPFTRALVPLVEQALKSRAAVVTKTSP